MVSEDQLKAVLEAVREAAGAAGRGKPCLDDECCCVKKVIYVIFTKCTTINNCAHEDWEFCKIHDDDDS
ncbi:MAG: hypothetical protein QMC81_05115 [Thermoanaerobacterales bacterium]|nr:hypothetical protein [Bacillota bacterium]MDI6906853.1 hypothetical protein [Thermoanaerobacterales bacterium]